MTVVKKTMLFIWLAIVSHPSCAADNPRKIVGLIFDSATLLPLAAVQILDENEKRIGQTNAEGYYEITVKTTTTDRFKFSIKLEKQGYFIWKQTENWGNLIEGKSDLFYFGLQKKEASTTDGFSQLITHEGAADQTTVQRYFKEKIKDLSDFNQKLSEAKASNTNVFIALSGNSYLVSDYAWIKLDSKDALVKINNTYIIPAYKINSRLRRSKIKSMSPVQSPDASYTIQTF